MGSIGLVVVNDWWLKGSNYSGWWSGKVSDLFGLFALSAVLIGLFCTASLTSRSLSQSLVVVSVVSVVFILMKTTEVGRANVESVWGFVLAPLRSIFGEWDTRPIKIVKDGSDVIAVPMAFLAIVYMRRRWTKLAPSPSSADEISGV